MFLVDTNVISAAAPARRTASPALSAWLDHRSDALYLSAITITEIADGIAKAHREGAVRKAAGLDAWLETLLHLYGDRVLAFDGPTARLAGVLADRARADGHAPGFADVAIGATAVQRGLTLLTRNLRHFLPMGIAALDPCVTLPD